MVTHDAAAGQYPPIGDYALIGDMHTCALVSKAGSIEWCCLPRFDSPAVFSRILDRRKGGHFRFQPVAARSTSRRYVPATNILETTFTTEGGAATLTDFMPIHPRRSPAGPVEEVHARLVVRRFRCLSGTVDFTLDCRPRFDYGLVSPRVSAAGSNLGVARSGSETLLTYCSAPLQLGDDTLRSEGTLRQGEELWAAVTYGRDLTAHDWAPDKEDLEKSLEATERFWRQWSAFGTYDGPYRDVVQRSALTLKALTYAPTGALLAAATTSLPEAIGGTRNWDYRFTWIRDAAFALYALFIIGYKEEAEAFREWVEGATAGSPRDLQIMYGISGEKELPERELKELEGYRGSRPVRVGNAAHSQFQLDTYGAVLDQAHSYRKYVGKMDRRYQPHLEQVVEFVVDRWQEPDHGIWETRGETQHFVFSKVMCWVALDRAVKAAEAAGLTERLDRWRRVREEIRDDVLANGYDAERGAFVQAYGGKNLDASALMLPLVGFIRAEDPRMRATIEAIQRELTSPEGFVYRYRDYKDGLPEGEGTFTICSFWLADNLIFLGETAKARRLYEKLLASANDLGLFSEEIDPGNGELLGNFPQAFSHLGCINTAVQLQRASDG